MTDAVVLTGPGHEAIHTAAEQCLEQFRQHPTPQEGAMAAAGRLPFRPQEHYGYGRDRCAVLDHDEMPLSVRCTIVDVLKQSRLMVSLRRFTLIRYASGDFLLPHRDDVASSLFSLTSSDVDGLVMQTVDDSFVLITDRAGRHVHIRPGAWHWVDPVRQPRFTLVVRPPVRLLDA
jgi:hypothetical protein